MTELQHLAADVDVDTLVETVRRDGAAIVDGLMSPAQLERVNDEIAPYVAATPCGRDAFSGARTTRTGALVARSAEVRALLLQPTILAAAEQFLAPWCQRVQLHLTQAIRIMPGQAAQAIHRDRWAWGTWLKGIEPQFNTIWAATDFTAENGATQVVPGSTDWPDDRRPEPGEIRQATMRAGSVLVYSGSVFHGGGANRGKTDRIGLNLTYALGWLRQEENQYLSCPPAVARALPERLQALLGYTLGSYALGYYTPPLPPGEGPEAVGPEHALGDGSDGSEAAALGSEALLEAISAQTRAPLT